MKKTKNKKDLIVYIIFNILVIATIIQQIYKGNFSNIIFCIVILLIYILPYIVQKKLKINLSLTLKILFYSFIYTSVILGEIYNFYEKFCLLDTILHILSGFLMGIIGYIIIGLLNNKTKFSLTPIFILFITFSFSITMGTLWELVEFSTDKYIKKDCQRDSIVTNISTLELSKNKKKPLKLNKIVKTKIYSDNGNKLTIIKGGYLDIGIIDTMKDLLSNLIGAIIICIIGYIYIKKDYKYFSVFFPKVSKE